MRFLIESISYPFLERTIFVDFREICPHAENYTHTLTNTFDFQLPIWFPLNFQDALHDLVLFVQFKKREKHPWRSVTFSLQLYYK